ncbi:MAG: winged helix DNA-binding domain-containing protein [Chryseosolibacter sp.]
MMDLTPGDIPTQRLLGQHLSGFRYKKPKELVSWMGAVQAQDYGMAKWALGIRLPAATQSVIQNAIDKGEIIRTHVLRPTWHFVSSEDVGWMLALTAPHIKASMASRRQQLELTPAVMNKSFNVIEKALRAGEHLTREELVSELGKAKINTTDQRAAHLLFYAELDCMICSGAMRGKKNTYALFAHRVKGHKTITREEALSRLLTRYFRSHGPATLQDFIWWSGLPVRDAKKAMEMAGKKFHTETIGTQTFWFQELIPSKQTGTTVHLLPAFDEYIISYKDRSACLPAKNHTDAISNNGIFKPVIVVNGMVIGLWRKSTVKNKVVIETDFFKKPKGAKELKTAMEEASAKVKAFFHPGQ